MEFFFIFIIFFVFIALFKTQLTRKSRNQFFPRYRYFSNVDGELLVARWLQNDLKKEVYKVINNIIIPDDRGGTTQIDHIVISPYGIFVIETKSLKGWIFGDPKSRVWTQQIFEAKYQFQNPFHQNYKHIVCLAKLIGLPINVFVPIIVFVGDCRIKTRDKLPKTLVSERCELINFIGSFSSVEISEWKLNDIRERILNGSLENSWKNRSAHKKYVRNVINRK